MTGFLMFIHAIISIVLVVAILMQSGRGGGLTEGFASAESMLGAQTNEFMIKATTVIASLFLATCLGLAVFSAQKGKSLMAGSVIADEEGAIIEETIDTVGEETQLEKTRESSGVTMSDVEKVSDSAEAITVEVGDEEVLENMNKAVPIPEKEKIIPEGGPDVDLPQAEEPTDSISENL